MDFLLNHTYSQIIDAGNQIEEMTKQLEEIGRNLSATIEITLFLFKW
eukprot:CAMPEP_0176338884 /NCGR_PEP_ID=MMETSP0126-20121128/308_1 /TAXON_ID=141414 ORGANISM="Strombidinopsis acuminatum, Strain SPMC142" /NCGR_SAMPLE_ID=MMETSP0126 /ASSEMBLY_ACC=CAM_ASM_000229 /LENGTH=46 /DNA_ID= /DNA_START= /DNA_END= /DNA_ORIENTATION=